MKKTVCVFAVAVSSILQSTAFADSVLFKATIDPKDTRQVECVKEVSEIPYSKAVLTPDGKVDLRFVADQDGRIAVQVLAETQFTTGAPVQAYVNSTELYVRTENTPFHLSHYEGLVRDVVTTAGDLSSNFVAISDFQTSVGGMTPQPSQILPISQTVLAIRGNTVNFTRRVLMDPKEVGIRIPKFLEYTTTAFNCEFEKVP